MDSNIETIATKPKIGIIGAGVSGIIAARHLSQIGDVRVFESKEDIGGVWLYTEESERTHPDLTSNAYYNLYGNLHSSLYYNLHTNIPKECMTWKDHYHSDETPYIMTPDTFHAYMKSYIEKFDLMKYINLSTTVTSLKVCEDSEHRYKLSYVPTNVNDGTESTDEYFDYVFVCNGHYTLSNIPDFEGRESFEGIEMHMHELRHLESKDFDDKNVLIVGAWVSANDIIINLLLNPETKDIVHPKKIFVTAKNVTSLENSPDYKPFMDSGELEVKSGNVSKICSNSVIFGDGSEEQIDTIVYATGYKYWMPFFDPEDKIIEFETQQDRGFYFGPLYKRMFCINEPNIFFIGLVEKLSLIHATYERQILLAKEVIEGKIQLPSKEEMLEDLEKELKYFEEIGFDKFKYYKFNMTYTEWHYNRDLEALTTMEIEKGYIELQKGLLPRNICYKEFKPYQASQVDYGKAMGDIDFKPTRYKF